ncbi:hypothetical protein XA68_16320 [Ophiocordyceps unilateralis]|uniref:Uncharacterized protein n=1 Tax=Ophiocordyceps unilateralis TaxID=268505 RepID=A0A2A9P6U1_OPHUN|nr:hypothetical protein XA68_16320 [Ophiocordyceps unilateralis]
MPLQQTVTVVNNSGKIISSGKKLFSIFKEAKGAYEEKKAELHSVKRSQTFDASRSIAPSKYEYDHVDEGVRRQHHRRSHHHHRPRRPALTEDNLKAVSETSSVARSVYGPDPTTAYPRRFSEPVHVPDGIDMDLAYGNIPPDLADRVDLDPRPQQRAQQLVGRVEKLLDEAHCLQHSAGAMIRHLQEKPDAAAEVALTLADLSSAMANMSPALVGLLKSGSPAVFALLASPQFLIGTTIAVGVTVVMFGGWKIVKRIQEAPAPLPCKVDDGHVDEALVVVDDQLSVIGSWRQGIMPLGADDESADVELMTPEADRATRDKMAKDDTDTKSHRSGRSSRRGEKTAPVDRDGSSRRSSRAASVRTTEDGRGRNSLDVVFRPKPSRQGDNMLKAVFRKRERESRGGGSGGSSSGSSSSSNKRELVLA